MHVLFFLLTRLELEYAIKAGHVCIIFGWSWTAVSVLGSQLYGRASEDSSALLQYDERKFQISIPHPHPAITIEHGSKRNLLFLHLCWGAVKRTCNSGPQRSFPRWALTPVRAVTWVPFFDVLELLFDLLELIFKIPYYWKTLSSCVSSRHSQNFKLVGLQQNYYSRVENQLMVQNGETN